MTTQSFQNQLEGNYWPDIEFGDSDRRREAVELFSGLVETGSLFNPFADIKPVKDPNLTWDKLTELEKRQILEVRLGPAFHAHLLKKAQQAGLDPKSLSWEEAFQFSDHPGYREAVPPPFINLFQHRPIRFFSEDPSPGDIYLRILTPEEVIAYYQNNPDIPNDPGGPLSVTCPDHYTASYWRLYGDGGRVILEQVIEMGIGSYGEKTITCP